MLENESDTYFNLEVYWIGRLSVVSNILDHSAQKHAKECRRKILKYRTMALVLQDREVTGRG